jgi:hypothetical protein
VDIFVINGCLDLECPQALEEQLLLGDGEGSGRLICSHLKLISARIETRVREEEREKLRQRVRWGELVNGVRNAYIMNAETP